MGTGPSWGHGWGMADLKECWERNPSSMEERGQRTKEQKTRKELEKK